MEKHCQVTSWLLFKEIKGLRRLVLIQLRQVTDKVWLEWDFFCWSHRGFWHIAMLILINTTDAREKTLNVDMIKSYALTNDEVS
jgi:hypothetical protein